MCRTYGAGAASFITEKTGKAPGCDLIE